VSNRHGARCSEWREASSCCNSILSEYQALAHTKEIPLQACMRTHPNHKNSGNFLRVQSTLIAAGSS